MPSGYDTLDDVDVFGNLIEMYNLVLGVAIEMPDLCGVLTTGTLDQSPSQHAQWGGGPTSFANHQEVWHVRSAPKGRIGQPLAHNEVRKVSVLVRKSATHRVARITNIKLWRLPQSAKIDAVAQDLFDAKDVRHADRGKRTYGAKGVGIHGIHLFASRERPTPSLHASIACKRILSSVAKITRTEDNALSKMEASTLPHYVVAASLAGFRLIDDSKTLPSDCQEQYDEQTWDTLCVHLALCFRDKLKLSPYARSEDTSIKLMMTAEDVYEQLSLIGYLDLRADPFFCGSLTDDMHRPSGLPLILALAVLIAAHPEKWGLAPTRMDDACATKEASLFVDSVVPAVLALDGGSFSGENAFAFDLVMKLAHSSFDNHQEVQPRSLVHKKERSVQETMHFLFCMGVAVCEDLFGLPPTGGGCASGQYTRYGFAAQLSDPMVESRAQSAYAMGLGNLVDGWPTLRTGTRGRRQLALADVLVEVNEWLCSGKYRGTILALTTEAPDFAHKNELTPHDPQPNAVVPRSAKKKKRVGASALLAERSRVRDAKQKHCTTESVRSIFPPCSRNDRRVLACGEKVCGAALVSAASTFSEVLLLGGCGGPSQLFEFSSYLVSPTMTTWCAHCTNDVHVVQSIAIAPTDLRNCVACGHPRCLECASRDMETGAALPADCNLCRGV